MDDKKLNVQIIGKAETWSQAVNDAAKEVQKHITPDCFLLITKDKEGHPATIVSADPADTAYLLVRAIEIIASQQNMPALQYLYLLQEFIETAEKTQTSQKVC